MHKRLLCLAALIVVSASIASAGTIRWTAGGTDGLWSTVNNWDLTRVPTLADDVFVDVPAALEPDGPVIEEGIEAKALGLVCEVPGEPSMTMTGGTLEIADYIWWGDGRDCHGTFHMSGGTITVVNEHELGWDGGTGTWIMTGGTVSAGRLIIPTSSGAAGQLYLHGGTFSVGSGGLSMTSTGLIDVTEGVLLLQGNRTGELQGYIDGRQITAYDGAGYFEIDFDDRNPGVTTLTAVALGDKANRPDPADGAVGVTIPLLRWEAGLTGMTHDVYLGKSPDALEPLGRQPLPMYYHAPGLAPGTTYYWRIDEIEGDGVTAHTGDVWHFMTQALTAYYPTPTDGAVDVSPTPELTWLPGQGTMRHHVYFSDSLADVNDATAAADKGEVEATTFAPGDLDTLATYYWRVDEITMDGIRVGPVWTFSTYQTLEDFESYGDDMDGGTAVFQTWIDGMENGTGSVVGYFESVDGTFNETVLVHGGLQSMPLDYNNVNEPFYSRTDRTWSPAQDWTVGGAGGLILFVRGNRDNDVAPLTVRIEDAGGQGASFVHPNPEIVRATKWAAWRIPFSGLTDAGANPTAVKKMSIGVGDPDDPVQGSTGLIYLDDILRTLPETAE